MAGLTRRLRVFVEGVVIVPVDDIVILPVDDVAILPVTVVISRLTVW